MSRWLLSQDSADFRTTCLSISDMTSVSTVVALVCQARRDKMSQTGRLTQSKFIRPSSGGWKFEIKVPAVSLSSEGHEGKDLF